MCGYLPYSSGALQDSGFCLIGCILFNDFFLNEMHISTKYVNVDLVLFFLKKLKHKKKYFDRQI